MKKTVFLTLLLAVSLSLFSLSKWDMTKSYVKGNEVIFNNKVWMAKWWNLNEVPGRFVDGAWVMVEELYDYSDNLPPSQLPPAGLKPEEVPMFIVIGSDDNFEPAGLYWLLDYIKDKKNSDGSRMLVSFYHPISSLWMQENTDAWMKALDAGYEIGNHTRDHAFGTNFTLEQWREQLIDTNKRLVSPRPYGLGAQESRIKGFRAPYLEYNKNSFKVIKELHMLYDSSMEEGWQFDQDGTNYYWPYTLNNGSPINEFLVKMGYKAPIDPVDGVWELPVYNLVTPTDEECRDLGIAPGFKERCRAADSFFTQFGEKINGLDWSVIHQYKLSEEDHFALLKYNLDKRMGGNRAPFIYGIHSNYYADPANQRAFGKFIDYALTKKEVRFVTAQQLIEWLRDPTPLESK